MKNWKKFFALVLCVAMLLSLAACGGSGDEAEAGDGEAVSDADTELSEEEAWQLEPMYGQTLTICYGTGSNCTGAAYVAHLLGFFEEEGLDVEVMFCGGAEAMDAVATGQAELVESHVAQMTIPIVNGLDLVMVGTAQTGCQSLYVLNDSAFQTTADLVGEDVGISLGYGSQYHNIVLRFMGRDGLNADDYNFKVVETSAVVQAMQNGEISASLLPDNFAYQFVKNGTLRSIRSITWDEDFKDEPCCVVALNKSFTEENPITAKKLARATAKASAWIDTHTEESVQFMLDNGMISGKDIDVLNYLQGSYDWTVTDAQCEETLRNVIDDYKGFGLIDSGLDTEETLKSLWWPLLSDEELEVVWAEGAAFDANA